MLVLANAHGHQNLMSLTLVLDAYLNALRPQPPPSAVSGVEAQMTAAWKYPRREQAGGTAGGEIVKAMAIDRADRK